MKIGWIINLQFGIKLHKKDQSLLEMIQLFFGGIGTISYHGKTQVQYRVSSLKELQTYTTFW